MSVLEKTLRKLIIKAGRLVHHKGFVVPKEGNISHRVDKDRFLITPAEASLNILKEMDLVILDLAGKKIAGENDPSYEFMMHAKVYERRPDINAMKGKN